MLAEQNTHLKMSFFLCLIATTLLESNKTEYVEYAMANYILLYLQTLNIIVLINLKSNISQPPYSHSHTKTFLHRCQLLLMVHILMLFQGCYTNIIGYIYTGIAFSGPPVTELNVQGNMKTK